MFQDELQELKEEELIDQNELELEKAKEERY